ncbi:Signal recognition particle 19 kDa protein [Zea mays]|uniref:Signal recognition particle 19 kDa protein n=1 Tax=Zea mays TaxID=4577 RepID=A0A1D6DTZ1_MAIZE|nr:Signal recognition particle 19 kDa protein [Zea mays]
MTAPPSILLLKRVSE